jgi:thymidylate kinase
MPPPILIIDGVTGAGKTSVLTELRSRMPSTVEFILEDDTLGDLMEQIRDPLWRAQPTFAALDSVLQRLEDGVASANGKRFVVERFHLTAFALFPQWEYYQTYDERLGKLGATIVLLTFPPEIAEARAIQRRDRQDWAEGMDDWYGSRAQAVDAVLESQKRRRTSLSKTRLPCLHIDTRGQEWRKYAETIIAHWTALK